MLGVLAIFDCGLLGDTEFQWLRIFADHAAVSIANARAFEEIATLKGQLEEENERLREEFRDLFDEAPIPYVYEGTDTRFIRANRAAMKTLGIKPEEVAETYGKSLVADTPETQRRLQEAFESLGRGSEANGVELEMRRKDNGQPLWVQWWSKPAPDGKSTRTMMVDITDRVLMEREQARLQAQNEYLQEEIRDAQNFGDIVGNSPALRKVLQQIHLVAPTDAAVLITGESGTGKELVARAIHENSPRKGRALIKVNCSAVPENLFESEFFGHTRGAFTGAVRDKPGRFELADGGTLFLDEIGDIPLAMQAKLLRVLQEQEIERVGDTRTRKINVRVVAATNRDLKKDVEAGRFRQDLVLSAGRLPHRDSSAARAQRRHPLARGALLERDRQEDEPAGAASHQGAQRAALGPRLARQRSRAPERRGTGGHPRSGRAPALRPFADGPAPSDSWEDASWRGSPDFHARSLEAPGAREHHRRAETDRRQGLRPRGRS